MDLALCTRETKLSGPQEGPAGRQEEAGAQKALESFQRAIIPDLSPCPPFPLLAFMCHRTEGWTSTGSHTETRHPPGKIQFLFS